MGCAIHLFLSEVASKVKNITKAATSISIRKNLLASRIFLNSPQNMDMLSARTFVLFGIHRSLQADQGLEKVGMGEWEIDF